MKNLLRNFLLVGLYLLPILLFSQEIEATSNPVKVSFKTQETNAPEIFMIYQNSGIPNDEGKVEVNIRVLDESGITELKINNESVGVNGQDTLMLTYSLISGKEIEVFAKDRFNNVREKSFIVQAQAVPKTEVTSTALIDRFHALIIGIDEYQDPKITSLSEAIKDATALKDVLIEQYTFKDENIIFLKNPTYEEIIITFEELSRNIGPGDLLLIFYAGHGYYNERTNIGYWLPADAQQANTVRWFRNSALVENIGAINSKHTLLISDACFSGSIFKTRSAFNNASEDISNLMKRTSRKAITSGSLSTVPDKSVFMKYLLKTLTENKNKYLPTEDLFDEVRMAMRNNSDTRPLFGEIRNVGDEGGNFVFIRKD
ncbi:MAG: caspase family protein [Cyclobacteriaceae bacterium]|nr:MAG: caspase family protein [Cyclobacteriaceae bacterium]